MKKILALVLTLCMLFSMTGFASAEAATGVVKVSAISDMGIYHQIVALIVEYAEEIVAPDADAYTVVDFASAYMKEDYDNFDYAEGAITAVYTNDVADRRKDKTSVPGKFVVIELEPVNGSFYDAEDGVQKVNHAAGYCTWRLAGEKCEWRRYDYSSLIVSQKKNVVNTAGDIVAKAAVLPTLQAGDIRHLKIERFETTTLKDEKGYDIHYSLSLPENYDASKKYAMVVSVSGNGGRLEYMQQDADGNLLCIGGNLGRDSAATAWLDCEEDLIILTPQPWRDQPEEWGIDIVEDTIYLIDYIVANYAVDTDRIYGIGSSFGTMHLSNVITRRPDIFAAYAQCNGCWTLDTDVEHPLEGPAASLCMYKDEYTDNVSDWTCTRALSLPLYEDCLKDKDEYWEAAKAGLQGVVANRTKIYVWHGVNDASISWPRGLSTYFVLRQMYEEEGLTEAEIDELVKLYFVDDAEYYAKGICEIHATSKLAVTYPWFMDWMLKQ